MQLDLFLKPGSGTKPPKKSPASKALKPRSEPSVAKPGEAAGAAGFDVGELQKHARQLLKAIHCVDLAQQVMVRWNPRMRSTAGTAYAAKALIMLNPRLVAFGAEEVDRTLRHELAHLLAHHRAGRRRIAAHGPEWRQACEDLGLLDEKRCHNLPLPRREMQRRHLYQCPNCGIEVRRVRPLRRKSACIACCRSHSRGKYDERFRFVKRPCPVESI